MDSLTEPGGAHDSIPRRVLTCSAGLCLALLAVGIVLAWRLDFPAEIALPVVCAFCWQAALYCAAVSEHLRTAVRRAAPPVPLAALLVAASVAPYAIYALPTGVFSTVSLLKLVLLCSCIAFPYALFPVQKRGWSLQDAVVACSLAYPMISGLSTLFRDIYQGFDPPAHRLDALGKLMLIPLGLYAFLELRRLQGTGIRLVPGSRDMHVAFRYSGYALPWLVLVGVGSGYLQWDPPLETPLRDIAGALGKLVGIYFTTALAEEFLLRGVVQNLTAVSTGRPLLAQCVSTVLFGAVHLGRGGFPNLPYAATSTVLGWFCARTYAKAGTVTAAMVTHALAVAGQELFFQ